jgi:hypothetical protein
MNNLLNYLEMDIKRQLSFFDSPRSPQAAFPPLFLKREGKSIEDAEG